MFTLSFTWLSAIVLYLLPSFALPTNGADGEHNEPLIRLLYEYPEGTWIENIAVRASGELLFTRLDQPHVEQFNPLEANAEPELVHSFEDDLSVMGIAEIASDSFAVIVGNITLTAGATPGSFSIWNVDFKKPNAISADVEEIAAIPDATFANGLTSIPSSGSVDNLLYGDIAKGVVSFVDTTTGESRLVINNSLTAAAKDPVFGETGVNGIHAKDGVLYFANTAKRLFASIPIHPNGTPAGEPHVITRSHKSELLFYFDDFAIRGEDAYLVTGSDNSIERIGLDGTPKGRIIAGSLNSTQIAGPTSAAFGRTPQDEHILYVVTSGGLVAPVDGDITIGAQIVAVDTRRW